MSVPNASCCSVVLTQQRHSIYQHHQSCDHQPCDTLLDSPSNTASKTCTVVENGRVVVKPLSLDPSAELGPSASQRKP
ncbi:MAG: hypothetical protein HC772_13710 [Leptolyngbyaceae cyanobacterium CRU_2_3]|nr:hypothetical protein [Leptolyngbyaceae cyanobacterium CRU_2_3]